MMTPKEIQEMFSGLQATMSKLTEKMEDFSKKLDAQDDKQEIKM